MKKILHFLIKILVFIFPRLKKAMSQDQKKVNYLKIDRNSKCYCNSGKKYKQCHLIINERKGVKAIKIIDDKGNEHIKLRKKGKMNIEVQNTFSETELLDMN